MKLKLIKKKREINLHYPKASIRRKILFLKIKSTKINMKAKILLIKTLKTIIYKRKQVQNKFKMLRNQNVHKQ